MDKYIFYKATEQEALDHLLDDPEFTPFTKQVTQYYIYKPNLINQGIDPNLLEEISVKNTDGLTPINPTKPMFPKK